MSVPGFRRSFREFVGQNPIAYRNNLRLILAKKLLTSGEYTVEEAAAQSGFTNLSFFYRLFRREYGQKPGSI
jgi:AraC family cel operon transcriptional repressor